MADPFLLQSKANAASLGAEGSQDLSAGGPHTGPFIALIANGAADAVVTFTCAITNNTHTSWTIKASGNWVGPIKDLTIVSGRVSAKKVTL